MSVCEAWTRASSCQACAHEADLAERQSVRHGTSPVASIHVFADHSLHDTHGKNKCAQFQPKGPKQ